jgi:ribosomal protein S18 acetylase RimI-like enzyme
MKYKELTISDAKTVAKLHKQNITDGFLSSLGDDILERIYASILDQKQNFGFIALEDDKPAGFILLTENCNILYDKFIQNNRWLGVIIISRKIFSPLAIKKITDHLFYPKKRNQLPEAELLSIAVDKKFRRRKIADKLAAKAIEGLKSRKIKTFITIVGGKLVASNGFMKAIGGQKFTEIEVHRGGRSNVYIWKL